MNPAFKEIETIARDLVCEIEFSRSNNENVKMEFIEELSRALNRAIDDFIEIDDTKGL